MTWNGRCQSTVNGAASAATDGRCRAHRSPATNWAWSSIPTTGIYPMTILPILPAGRWWWRTSTAARWTRTCASAVTRPQWRTTAATLPSASAVRRSPGPDCVSRWRPANRSWKRPPSSAPDSTTTPLDLSNPPLGSTFTTTSWTSWRCQGTSTTDWASFIRTFTTRRRSPISGAARCRATGVTDSPSGVWASVWMPVTSRIMPQRGFTTIRSCGARNCAKWSAGWLFLKTRILLLFRTSVGLLNSSRAYLVTSRPVESRTSKHSFQFSIPLIFHFFFHFFIIFHFINIFLILLILLYYFRFYSFLILLILIIDFRFFIDFINFIDFNFWFDYFQFHSFLILFINFFCIIIFNFINILLILIFDFIHFNC